MNQINRLLKNLKEVLETQAGVPGDPIPGAMVFDFPDTKSGSGFARVVERNVPGLIWSKVGTEIHVELPESAVDKAGYVASMAEKEGGKRLNEATASSKSSDAERVQWVKQLVGLRSALGSAFTDFYVDRLAAELKDNDDSEIWASWGGQLEEMLEAMQAFIKNPIFGNLQKILKATPGPMRISEKD